MDIKKLGTFFIAIGLIIVFGSGLFYAVNMDKEVSGSVAFMAGFGNKQAQVLWEKQENRENAKHGFIPGIIVTIFGIGLFISAKGANPKSKIMKMQNNEGDLKEKIMDSQTKKMIGVVLILLGIAAVGVIGYDYIQYLQHKNSGALFSGLASWRWTSGEIFQMIAGFISMGAGIFILSNAGLPPKN